MKLKRLLYGISFIWLIGLGYAAGSNEPGHWIVVTPPGLRQAIEPLCQHRRQEGFQVQVVQTDDIDKSKDPSIHEGPAIQQFLHARYTELKGPVYVVLVGSVIPAKQGDANALPSLAGQLGRMKNRPSDAGYSLDSSENSKTVMVGRLPAQTTAQLALMVEKILRFEQSSLPGPWKYRLSIMAGNPGGETLAQKNLSGWFVRMIGQDCISRINPFWCVDGLIHVKGSEFYVPDDQLASRAKSLLEEGQVFSFYLGHSSPAGLWSDEIEFLNQKDWADLKISNQQGILFTCGCYACWIAQPGKPDGYALTAMRNPQGPAAVIGAFTKSDSAIGQLAFNGMLECLGLPEPPERLGNYWESVRNGIACGPMNPMTFMLYDYADGSKGTKTLDYLRREHLQMWMLLGDPAMRLPIPSKDIELAPLRLVVPGETIEIEGTTASQFEGGFVTLTLEKTLRKPTVLVSDNWQADGYAKGHILDQIKLPILKGGFSGQLHLPKISSPVEIVLRAYAVKGDRDTMRVQVIDIDWGNIQ